MFGSRNLDLGKEPTIINVIIIKHGLHGLYPGGLRGRAQRLKAWLCNSSEAILRRHGYEQLRGPALFPVDMVFSPRKNSEAPLDLVPDDMVFRPKENSEALCD